MNTKKLALVGAASATAIAVGLTPAVANALASETLTVGLPLGIEVDGTTALPSDPQAINNAIVAVHDDDPIIPFNNDPRPIWFPTKIIKGVFISNPAAQLNTTIYGTNVNVIAYEHGSFATSQAYRAMLESAAGETREGYDPVQGAGDPRTYPRTVVITGDNPLVTKPPKGTEPPAYTDGESGRVIDEEFLVLVLLKNPSRANGGLYTRFPEITGLLANIDSEDVVTPERQDFTVDGRNYHVLITDMTWEYDLLSDAPATPNPIAWANSVASYLFLTNLITGIDSANPEAPEGTVVKSYTSPDGTIYVTYAPNQLPLLAPVRMPAQLIGAAIGQDVNTPMADAIEPALKMVIDLSYTDVVRNEDGTYSRALDQMHVNTPFMSESPLTHEGWLQVPGDLLAATGAGVGNELTDVLTRAQTHVSAAVDVDLSTEQKQGLGQALQAPGTTIKTVSRDVGDGVNDVLTGVGSLAPAAPALPKHPSLTPSQFGNRHSEVRTAITEANDNAKAVHDQVKKTRSEVKGAAKSAVNEVRANVKKAVDGVKSKVGHSHDSNDKP